MLVLLRVVYRYYMADEESGRWRPLERGGAEWNPQGIVAAQGRPDGGRHRPFPGPIPVLLCQLSRIKCCVHCPLCGLLGDATGDAKGENNFSEVRHLLAPCLSP